MLTSPTTTPEQRPGLRTLIVGAGEAGWALARDLLRVPEFGLDPVGFLDDDQAKPGNSTLPLLGGLEQTESIVVAHRVEVVVVAIPGLSPQRFRQVTAAATATGASVRYLPTFIAALRREVVGGDMRTLDVNRLIGRQEVHVAGSEARRIIAGRRVLVTGAGARSAASCAARSTASGRAGSSCSTTTSRTSTVCNWSSTARPSMTRTW